MENKLIVPGYIVAFVGLFLLPPICLLIGCIIGIINITRDNVGHGIAQIVLSIICGIMGMAIGAAAALLM